MLQLQPYTAGWRERGLDIVLVTRDTEGSVEVLLRENNLSYPVLLDTMNEGGKAYNVGGIPHTVFIDAGGTVRRTHIGWGGGSLKQFKAEAEKVMPSQDGSPASLK
ncbi:MAG: TlpA disulfide reductase family protein [Bacillota bacterium]|nr:TlpA disulfide reductase family protein [Bacillota bacterium]